MEEKKVERYKEPKGAKPWIIAAIIIVLFFILEDQIFVVTNENEYTVVKQFGKIKYIVDEPGLSTKIPFIQSTDKIKKEILLYDIPASDVISSDKKSMIMDCYVLYRISDPLAFAKSLNNSISNAEYRLDTVVYNAVKTVVSSMTQEEVIEGRKNGLAQKITENIGNSLEKYGLTLVSIEEKLLDLPDDNKGAVYDRMISERQKIAATYTATGEKDSNIIKNETNKEVDVMLAEAEAKAATIIGEGEGEYMRILSEAYGDESRKEFYKFIISLEAMEGSLKNEDNVVILDKNSSLGEMFSR